MKLVLEIEDTIHAAQIFSALRAAGFKVIEPAEISAVVNEIVEPF